ncbi:glycoside hydrolase family 31 protein [Puniceicoccus vermicola]|uniref:DUF5110 domain-containing protein n=1 Tax=Puniceicoccus vermicola TaxID=388746 RepID=A0A7X1B1V7_9BACT|nr:TIM-barrel domain-containing protein [Puniceicoccus vermicola]MBC2602940.1 DUF5110 domain-containing protein [Puniceicoccus vermicola]
MKGFENARFSCISSGLVRMEYDPEGRFEDRKSVRALARPEAIPFLEEEVRDDGTLLLRTEKLEIHYKPDGRPFHSGNLKVHHPHSGDLIWTPGQVDEENLGGAHMSMDAVQRGIIAEGVHPATDAYHVNDHMFCLWAYKGWGIEAANYDASGSLEQVIAENKDEDLPAGILKLLQERRKYPPGILSRAGYFLYNDSEQPVIDPETNWLTPRGAGDEALDLYLFVYGNDFKEALADYIALFGPAPMPPRYSLGLWYSRYPTFNREGLEELISEFSKRDLPLDVLVLDLEWHQHGWIGWDWDESHIPNPKQFLDELHAQSIYTTLNLHPKGVPIADSRYQDFIDAAGIDPVVEERPDGVKFAGNYELTEERHAAAFMDVLHKPIQEDGVDFWWIDGPGPGDEDLICPQFWTNEVFFRHIKENSPERRPMIYSRSAGLGSHRYPFYFTGDTLCQFEVLESQVEYTLRAGHIGQSMMTHDIGGHKSSGYYLDLELYLRWLQWGVMSPVCRLHSSYGGERRPWKYESELCEIAFAKAIRWRMELLPYFYTLTWESSQTGLPLCRSNPLEAPDWEEGYSIWDSYFLGDRIYCAPIVTPGSWRDLHLPPGEWVHMLTGESFTGDQPRRLICELDIFPVFVRKGSIVVKQDYSLRAGFLPRTLCVELHPAGPGHRDTFTLYLDDGISCRHEQGHYNLIEFRSEETEQGVAVNWKCVHRSTDVPMPEQIVIKVHGESLSLAGVEGGQSLDVADESTADESVFRIEMNEISEAESVITMARGQKG